MVSSISVGRYRRGAVVFPLEDGVDVHVIRNEPVEARPSTARTLPAKKGGLLSFFDCRRKICEVLFKASVADGLVNP